ncbi:Solute carrier family 23 member 2 [Portunus trituberculatus]|uniref:Solute carrier family 23 member 2 n=1 Tax=Portunus trituberculatus TaxID=210409 RepID=A0A5B7EFI7_PORTR|nr:Solute carrier family 23 member 2 [Portunus trituberculatus]
MICGTVPIPFMVSSLLCFGPSHPMRGYLVSTIIFVSGVNTLLQSTLGVRLPIIQGGNFAFLLPSIAFLSTNYMSCEAQQSANLTVEDQEELWRDKIRLIQGSIAVSSVFQIFLGFTGQWGVPRVVLSAVVGCMAAGFASTVESIGDYFICARISDNSESFCRIIKEDDQYSVAIDRVVCMYFTDTRIVTNTLYTGGSPPPMHALNRGVMIEGVGVALAGLFGTGSGINSYSENIATLVITRVGSRRVIQVSAVLMMALGLFSKFGALCGSLPTPIVASLYFVLFSYIVSASLPMLHMIKLHSPRNLFILGFSVFFSLSISKSLDKDYLITSNQ